MGTTNFIVCTDEAIKEAAEEIFKEAGLTMTSAINIFLRQTIHEKGIPFDMKLPEPNNVTVAAIAEGRALALDDESKGYDNMNELRAALEI